MLKKGGDEKTRMKSNQGDHTCSIHHSRTCVRAHANGALADAL